MYFVRKFMGFWKSLGAGFITGASDDEPSAIATYTIAGAKFGYSMLWASLFSLPFMIAMQEMSGRIGRVSNRGLAGNMKRHYPRWLMLFIAILIVTANTVNIGANMSAMTQAIGMVTGFNQSIHYKFAAITITIIILLVTILLPYRKIFAIFKWTALSLFAYIFATFTVHQDWGRILFYTLIPHFESSREYFLVLIAFWGTTISPYLFFWQANQEVEEKILEQCKPGQICRLRTATNNELRILRRDTWAGMTFSNIITFFIIVLSASALFAHGFNDIETLEDAAKALVPFAGKYAYILFTLGIVSSGFLGIPVLAGSAAYVVSEVFGWSEGLNRPFAKAKEFYGIVVASTIVGLMIPLFGLHPVKALFYTSIIYGVIAPILIYMVIHMANNKKIMGEHTNTLGKNIFGYTIFGIMSILAVLTFFVL
jgi:NRAMP (natural resistance-associated macrophage protein)-like metal ion transporter